MAIQILHTIASVDPSTGGPARSVPQLAAAQSSAGADVCLWAADGTKIVPSVCAAGVQQIGQADPHDAMASCNATLIHDHGLWLSSNHAVARIAGELSVPRVVSPRGMLEPWALNHRRWKKKAAWWLYQRRDLRRTAGLHATAESEAEQFRRLGLGNPIEIIANGIEFPSKSARQGRADIVPSARTALFLSRIHQKKGLPMLAQAWAQARPKGWRMVVAGPDEGGHRQQVEQLIDHLGLREQWSFRGEVYGDEKWRLLAEADLFILPTHSENFGICVAEALAVETPVLTTTGAPWQGLIDHQCGWWVPPTVEGLVKGLDEACKLPAEALGTMGACGQRWARDTFDWSKIAEQMIAFYEQLIGGRS